MQTEDAVERFNNMPVGGLFHSTCWGTVGNAYLTALGNRLPWSSRKEVEQLPFLTLSGRHALSKVRPLSGTKRTSELTRLMSAFDPKRTFA
jgi:hypothetical protein